MKNSKKAQGFTLVELITVMVILGVLGASFASRMMPHTTLQLQGGRDLAISAFFMAQQKAMSQNYATQVLTDGNTIDVRLDQNQDDIFSADESIRLASSAYPLSVGGGIVLNATQFVFDRLGHTTAGSVQLSKGDASVTITVTGTGYAY